MTGPCDYSALSGGQACVREQGHDGYCVPIDSPGGVGSACSGSLGSKGDRSTPPLIDLQGVVGAPPTGHCYGCNPEACEQILGLQRELYKLGNQVEWMMDDNMRMTDALELIAATKRPDGSWNRDREACRELAEKALRR